MYSKIFFIFQLKFKRLKIFRKKFFAIQFHKNKTRTRMFREV